MLNTILLVEDNPGDARLLCELLSENQADEFEITVAGRIAEAKKSLREKPFDVVLLDLSLPDGNGLESFRVLREQSPATPIVVLTGLDDDALALKAVQEGAQDYLVKGQVTSPLLTRALRYAIERQRLQTMLLNLSIIDELTGLHNRRGFLMLGEQQLKATLRTSCEVLVVFIDLDDMKTINDTYGHHEGDWVLIKTAEVLRQTFRESDVLARLGGDEFTVLALVNHRDDAQSDDAQSECDILLARLQANAQSVNALQWRPYHLSLTAGAVRFQQPEVPPLENLLARADEVLYEQKRRKRLIVAE